MIRRFINRARQLSRDSEGLTTVEYIIILCLVAVVGFSAWKTFGETVESKVNNAESQVIGTLPDSP